MAWAITFFSGQLHSAPRRSLALAGIVLATLVLCAWALHSCRLALGLRTRPALRAHSRGDHPATRDDLPAEDPPASPGAGEDASSGASPDAPRAEVAASLARRAVARLEEVREETALPGVLLLRAGAAGVELLLSERVEHPPSGFELRDAGWSLRPLAAAVAPAPDSGRDRDGDGGGGGLVELGSDGDGTYFVPSTTAVVTADAAGEVAGDTSAQLVVVREPTGLVVEPFGLYLSPPDLDSPDDPGPEGDTVLGAPVAETLEVREDDHGSGDGGFPDEGFADDALCDELPGDLAPGRSGTGSSGTGRSDSAVAGPPGSPAAPQRSPGARGGEVLVPPGPVEVRILREEPDLVGELHEEPVAAGVEFVAFLATHGHRATTAKLRDALGTARSRSSRSGRTVWNAAGFARRCLGEARVPQASGVYEVSKEVTSDWGRFCELVKRAAAPGEPALARRGLTEALALVEGVPAAASSRYLWLDTERLLAEITAAVVRAACRLAEAELGRLGAGEGEGEGEGDASRETAAWAIRKGRLVSPHAPELELLDERLAAL